MGERKVPNTDIKPKQRPAISQFDRENQIAAMAFDLVEERIRNGTATSQETTTCMKLGLSERLLEIEKLENEIAVLKAKKDALDAGTHSDEAYLAAIQAMREYQGAPS